MEIAHGTDGLGVPLVGGFLDQFKGLGVILCDAQATDVRLGKTVFRIGVALFGGGGELLKRLFVRTRAGRGGAREAQRKQKCGDRAEFHALPRVWVEKVRGLQGLGAGS